MVGQQDRDKQSRIYLGFPEVRADDSTEPDECGEAIVLPGGQGAEERLLRLHGGHHDTVHGEPAALPHL